MPDALELPWMRRAVVPQMLAHFSLIYELVALALRRAFGSHRLAGRCARLVPCLTAIIGALDDLPKPAAGLRRVNPIRVSRRSLEMVHFPTRKERTADVPLFAFAVRRQNEGALTCPNEYAYRAQAHSVLTYVFGKLSYPLTPIPAKGCPITSPTHSCSR